ncbi:hypothetical protein ACHAXS_007654 [Conticribra weissflogii]
MVKFSFLAFIGAYANASVAKYHTSFKLGKRQLRRVDASTEALLRKARPYKKANAGRKLEGQEDAVELDGSYSVKFSQCVDVRTKNEDLFSDELIAYAQSGSIVSSKSYVLFHVCQGNNCYYESDEDLYIVDLATYLANVATYHVEKRQNYCEACDRFQDTCIVEEEVEEEAVEEDEAGEDEEAVEEEEAAEEGAAEEEDAEDVEDEPEEEDEAEGEEKEDEDKAVKTTSRRTTNYIDCNQCFAYNCYADDDDADLDDGAQQQQNMDELDNQVAEWIAKLGECQESGTQDANGNNLYIGAMCGTYGDGVELAVFLDEECSIYTSEYTFNSVYNPDYDANEINYVIYAENYIKSAFEEVMPCLEVEYDDPNEEQDDNAAEEEEERYEMNEYCEGLLNDDAIDFNQCQDADDQQDEDNEDDQYAWYTFDIENADNIEEVCQVVYQMQGEYYHSYDETSSGTWYSRNSNGQIITVSAQNNQGKPSGLSGGAIAAIALVCVGVVGVAAYLMKPKKASDSNTPVYQGGTML